MTPGRYSYRFSGHAMSEGVHHFLAGVGTIVLEPGNKLSGFHTSSLIALSGQDSKVKPRYYTLTGNYGPRRDAYSAYDEEARITFTQVGKNDDGSPLQKLKGKYAIVPAGGEDGFWLLSTASHHDNPQNTPAVEMVLGEAIRVRDAKKV
jgi:hypothetical protein